MRALNRTFFILLILGMFTSISKVAAQNEEKLDFSISVPKSSYAIGEPIVVVATLTNKGEQSVDVISIFDPKFSFASYTITSPDGKSGKFKPTFIADIIVETVKLEVGKSISDFAPLFYGATGHTFKRPGRYTIIGSFSGIDSNPLTLEVKAPENDNERSASQLMLRDQVGLFLLVEGAETLTQAKEDLNTISTSYPSLIHADYANFALGAYYSKIGRDFKNNAIRRANYAKAESLLVKIVDKPLPSYFKIRNYSNIIKVYNSQKKTNKVREYLQKLENEFKQNLCDKRILDEARDSIRKSQQ